jgi:Spy/CpxP family protein refolding chaperone
MAVVTLAGLAAMPAAAQADTTTRPGNASVSPGMRPGPAFVIQRLKRAVSQLNLTDDEKTKVDAFFDAANQQGIDLSQTLADMQPPERYQKLAAFGHQLRQQLSQVLTNEQMKTVDQELERRPGPGPATRPGIGADGAPGRNGPGGEMIENLRQAIAKLDLSDDQKKQVADLLESTRQKMADLRQKAQAGEDVQADMQQVRQNMREQLQTILTPDQMQSLMQAIQQIRQERGQSSRSAPEPGGGKPGTESDVALPADLQTSGPDAGSPVPDVRLIELNGHTFTPSKYKGHVLVLEFGSMSCPVFRQHAQEMETLKTAEGPRAFFMIVYTREAFPAGDKDVQRNKDEGISVPQAATLDDRKAEALEAQRELRITIPMAVDSMDDAVSNAYGTFPNGAIVIGKDGTIATRQQWTNPDTLRVAIDQANAAPAAP